MFYQFSVPTKVIYGEGISKDFSHELGMLNVSSVFLITDKGIQKAGLIDPILEHLKENDVQVTGIYDDVPPDSSVKTIEACVSKMQETKPQAIIAIGGGSVLDTAKGVNVLYSLGGDLKEDYSGAQTITEDLHPLIAIPTTAGTGSEVTEAMVIYDEESKSKLSFVDYHLLPRLTVLDPELTVGLPLSLTVATALDALTHAVESIYSVQNNPVSDALAFQAIKLIYEALPEVVKDSKNVEWRGKVLQGANLAGIAFNHSMVGVVHSVAHSIGAVCKLHHGHANAIFLPYGLEFNLTEAKEQIAKMDFLFGIDKNQNEEQRAVAVIQKIKSFVEAMLQSVNLATSYHEAGMKEEQIDQVLDLAIEDGSSFYNPREVETETLRPFFKKAF